MVEPRKGGGDCNKVFLYYLLSALRRTPQGVRGLKFQMPVMSWIDLSCRTPQGVRGLKSALVRSVPTNSCRTPQRLRGWNSYLFR